MQLIISEGGRVAITGLNPGRLASAAEQMPKGS